MANNSIVKHLVIDAEKTLGELVAVQSNPYNKYSEGIKGVQEGIKFSCLSKTLGYEKVEIKVAGLMNEPFPLDGTPVPVEFEGLEAKVWQDWRNGGEIKLSITAKAIRPLAEKRIKLGGDKA